MMLLMLVACGGDFSSLLPTVKFSRFDLQAVDFERISVDFVFDVDNPNPIGFPLNRFAYALDLADVEIISGANPDGLELVADGTSELALPVSLTFASIFELIDATRGVDTVPFAFRGGFGWDTDIGPVDVAFDEGGDFPALRTPRIDLGELRVGPPSGTGVEFALDLDVDNDHGSPLDLQAFAFDMSVAGVRVGGGRADSLGSVPGADSRTVSLPLQVDYVDAAAAIAAAASGTPIRVGLGGSMDIDTPFGIVPLTIDEQGNVEVGSD